MEGKPKNEISAVMAGTMTVTIRHTTVKVLWSPTPADNPMANGCIDGRVLQQRVAKYCSLSALPHSLLVHRI